MRLDDELKVALSYESKYKYTFKAFKCCITESAYVYTYENDEKKNNKTTMKKKKKKKDQQQIDNANELIARSCPVLFVVLDRGRNREIEKKRDSKRQRKSKAAEA